MARRRSNRGQRTDEVVPPADLTQIVTQLQRQVEEQQQIMITLMTNVSTLLTNQQKDATTPSAAQNVMPTAPSAPPASPITPAVGVRQEAYLIQWQKLKPESFAGTSEPWDAQAWFKTLESIMELLDWPENEKVKCASFCLAGDARIWWERVKTKRVINQMTWCDFETEFFEEFFHMRVTNKHYDEFTEFRQGDLPVSEAVQKFNRLARLCPELVSTERERVRLMLKMLRPEIALNVNSGVSRPQTAEELISSALLTEHYLNNIKQQKQTPNENKSHGNFGGQKSHNHNGKGNNNGKRKQWNNFGGDPANKQPRYPVCSKCGKTHLGVCRKGMSGCYTCGQEGHMAKDCPTKNNPPPAQSSQYGGKPAQLHQMQGALEGPHIGQGRLEAPPVTPNARIYSLARVEDPKGPEGV